MKKHLLAASAAGVLALTSAASAATYSGNGATGFGGPVGNGTLTITDGGSTVDFSFTPGTAFTGNVLVLYIDSAAGGFADTSSFTDSGDDSRRAISGFNSNGEGTTDDTRTLATFAPGFTADRAIAVLPQYTFAGAFNLDETSNFSYIDSGNLSGSDTGPFTFSFDRSELGLPSTGDYSFAFEGTLISGSAYRSNETIGASVTVPGSSGDAPNAGFTGTQTFTTANTFVVPEPATASLLALGGLTLLRRRR